MTQLHCHHEPVILPAWPGSHNQSWRLSLSHLMDGCRVTQKQATPATFPHVQTVKNVGDVGSTSSELARGGVPALHHHPAFLGHHTTLKTLHHTEDTTPHHSWDTTPHTAATTLEQWTPAWTTWGHNRVNFYRDIIPGTP